MKKSHAVMPGWVLYEDTLRLVSDFADLPPKRRPCVYCPHCKRQVVMKLGRKVVHHFAHKFDCDCIISEPESALHLNTKVYIGKCLENTNELFVNLYCSGFPDIHSCEEPSPFQIFEGWDEVRIECSFGSLRPDIGLFRDGVLIFAIEICATHPIPDEKIKTFEEEGVLWLEVKADSSLFDGKNKWSSDKPLKILRGSPLIEPPLWNCGSCVQWKKEFDWRQENYEEVRYEKAVDMYYPSGKSYRQIFRVWVKVENGELSRTWLTRKKSAKIPFGELGDVYGLVDEQIGPCEFAPIGKETSNRLKIVFQQYLESQKVRQSAIVDSPMKWREYDPEEHGIYRWVGNSSEAYTEDEEPLLCRYDYPQRYVWNPKTKKWFIPRQNQAMRWDNPHSIVIARAADEESLKDWKRNKIREEARERQRMINSLEKLASENSETAMEDVTNLAQERRKKYGLERVVRGESTNRRKLHFEAAKGRCLFCGRMTNQWWFFDGATKACKCNDCLDRNVK